MSKDDALKGFPVQVEAPVRWGDMDAYQHVNNTVYFRFFETARIAYAEALGDPAFLANTGVGMILAETSCRFRLPVTYPDTVVVGARTVSRYDYGFIHEYVLVSRGAKAVAATGTARIVTYDYAAQVKAKMPEHIQQLLAKLEGKPVPHVS